MIDLSTYSVIQSHLFVNVANQFYFCDRRGNYTLDAIVYTGTGNLMGVTATPSEIRSSGGEITITLSGIPNNSISSILTANIKGSPVQVTRVLFDATTSETLNISGNPLARFRGFVNNLGLQEDYDPMTRTSTNTIVLTCSSALDVLSRKMSGRKTNPYSTKKFYPDDLSMDRVPTLENSTFDFGAPK